MAWHCPPPRIRIALTPAAHSRAAPNGDTNVPSLRLADYLRTDLVLWDLPRLDKPSFMKTLAARVASRLPAVDERELLDRLLAREAEQSTGIGAGLALPHAIVPGLEKTLLVVGRAREGLDFASLDAEPVDLIFLLLSPPGSEAQHLRLLARLARIFHAEEMLEKLRSATGPEELLRMLREEDARHVY
jgi:mannitol/fructose-specific phosphotransferase system IIA component (Ntr-type)